MAGSLRSRRCSPRRSSGLGEDGKKVGARLEREFADYLEKRRKATTDASSRASFWRMFDVMAVPLGRQVAKQLAERLLEADPDRPAATPQGGPEPASPPKADGVAVARGKRWTMRLGR